uniref:Glucose-fructose oxidoreductase domain-containing protein 2 n=1 Tax=Neogobius melanostomus TaxID=47308 RepID=A0A8C6UD85_9GOBI
MLPGVGVFGTGTTARVLVPLLKSEGFEVHALWDKLNIPFHTSRSDDVLLHQEVDLVCIYIPPSMTRQIAVKALGIGKNVVCEKAATAVDSFKMVTAARYYPQLLSTMGNTLRFLPAFAAMHKLLLEGYVGEVQVCDVRVYGPSLLDESYGWTCEELMGGGGLHTVGSSPSCAWSAEDFVQQNNSIRGIRRVTSDDFCFFQMLMSGKRSSSGGVCCTVTLNFNMPGSFVHEVMVVGSAGRLIAKGTELYGQQNGKNEELLLGDNGWSGPEVKMMPMPQMQGLSSMVKALRLSFQAHEERRSWAHEPVAMAPTFEDGLYVQTVVEAIKRSSTSGEWASVDIMMEEPDPNHNLCEALQRNKI